MESFEDLGLDPSLVEALAGEGIERPTPLQSAGVPVVRRGNNLVGHAGPGAGTLVMYGAALLDRIEPGGGAPRALVLTPTADTARSLATALARLAQATGHAVASLGAPWAFAERADVLFATPAELLAAVRGGGLGLEGVQALVLESASAIERVSGLDVVEEVLQYLPREAQRVVVSLPVTAGVADLVERHVRRAVHVPPQTAPGVEESPPRRGEVHFRIVDEPGEEATLALAADLLAGDIRHLVLYFRSEDRAADLGDFLTLHGFDAGAPGDASVPVWLAVDELETLPYLEAAGSGAAVVSVDVPAGPDSLDRRHGAGRGGTVLVFARELAHLRDVARRTGYRVVPAPPPPPAPLPGDLGVTVEAVRRALAEEDLAPYLLLLAPLLAEHDPAELAAAAVALLRRKQPGQARPAAAPSAGPPPPPAWVRLYVSLGERDQISARDLVGAITGEAGIEGGRVGKIEMRETFSLVEVHEAVAEQVIKALNGTTIRGRSTRVDFDRGRRTSASGPAPGRNTGPPRRRP